MKLLLLLVGLACLGLGVEAQDRTFCDRYSEAVFGPDGSRYASNQTAFIRSIVYRAQYGCAPSPPPGTFHPQDTCADGFAFEGIVSPNSPILDVFQGRVPFKPDAVDLTNPANVNETNAFIDKMVVFFRFTLGCTAQPELPPYYPVFLNQGRIHDGMRITQEGFSFFNSRITASMRSFGVSEKDITYIVKPILTSFGACSAQPICQDLSCELGTVVADANCKARYDRSLTQMYDVEGDRRKWTISFVPAMVNLVVVGLMLYVLYGMLQPRASDYKQTSSGRK